MYFRNAAKTEQNNKETRKPGKNTRTLLMIGLPISEKENAGAIAPAFHSQG